MMKYFKLPLIVTAIVIPLMIVAVVASFFWLDSLEISNREKAERAARLGGGVATVGCVVLAPFWWVAAARLGKAKRQQSNRKKRR
jgi:ABC-type Co2+ transport system permease subunit